MIQIKTHIVCQADFALITRLGYRLQQLPTPLDLASFTRDLKPSSRKRFCRAFGCLPEKTSTRAKSGDQILVVVMLDYR